MKLKLSRTSLSSPRSSHTLRAQGKRTNCYGKHTLFSSRNVVLTMISPRYIRLQSAVVLFQVKCSLGPCSCSTDFFASFPPAPPFAIRFAEFHREPTCTQRNEDKCSHGSAARNTGEAGPNIPRNNPQHYFLSILPTSILFKVNFTALAFTAQL